MSYGEPSKGLMQTIPGTFDPLTNLKASARYAMDRYGTVTGRILPTATARVRAGEYILSPEAVRDISGEPTFEHLMRKGMLGDWQDEEPPDDYPEPPPPPVF